MVLVFYPNFEVLFILGRPLLTVGWALIDVATWKLTMRAHEKVKVFDVNRTLKLPSIYEELFSIMVVDHSVELKLITPEDPLERV